MLADSFTAQSYLAQSHFDTSHIYAVDWAPGEYIRWYLDGTMMFEINKQGLVNQVSGCGAMCVMLRDPVHVCVSLTSCVYMCPVLTSCACFSPNMLCMCPCRFNSPLCCIMAWDAADVTNVGLQLASKQPPLAACCIWSVHLYGNGCRE